MKQIKKNLKKKREVKAKKKKGISLEELIRRQEYKRVWDDSGWDHYLSGKKYNKI